MRKVKQFSLALAVVCALSTACGQSGRQKRQLLLQRPRGNNSGNCFGDETKAAVASGEETAAEQTLDTTGLVRYLQTI